MKSELQKKIHDCITSLYPEANLILEEIDITYPPEQFGDYTCNVAMKLAGKLKRNPFEIAQQVKEALEKETENIKTIEIAKPGYLNIFLKDAVFVNVLGRLVEKKDDYGKSQQGKGKKIMVEFGQPNTHKAFHVGHLRSAISGLAVVNMYQALGYEVIRANYFGDVGMHVAKTTWAMGQSPLPEGFDGCSAHERMKYIDMMYVKGSSAFKDDPAAQEAIRKINKDIYEEKNTPEVALYRQIRAWSLEHLDDMFKHLGVSYDRQYPESEVYKDAYKIVKDNTGKIFQKSEGAIIYDGSHEGLTTWVFLTKEGVPTYSAKDLALAIKKFSEYDLDGAVVTTSVEQTDYFKVIIHCLELLRPEFKGKYKHVPFGWLLRGHKKTSSRMGDTVKGIEVIEEARKVASEKVTVAHEFDESTKQEIIEKVALSGLKFLILSHEFHNNINYDPDEFIKLKGYSGPFILYSYVRTQSILRKLGQPKLTEDGAELSLEKEERDVMKSLMMFPDVVLESGTEIAPHKLCNYLYALAQKFNVFYENCSIQNAPDEKKRQLRLQLTKATGQVLKNGLEFLGIATTEVM